VPYVGNTGTYRYVIKQTYFDTKAILKGWKSGLFVNICQFLWMRILNTGSRIQESQMSADPESVLFAASSSCLRSFCLIAVPDHINWLTCDISVSSPHVFVRMMIQPKFFSLRMRIR
jgi:hypothetical protein